MELTLPWTMYAKPKCNCGGGSVSLIGALQKLHGRSGGVGEVCMKSLELSTAEGQHSAATLDAETASSPATSFRWLESWKHYMLQEMVQQLHCCRLQPSFTKVMCLVKVTLWIPLITK